MLLRSPRPHRSSRLTLLAAGALLSTSLLAGCGFDYQTDRVNTVGSGINDRTGGVDVLGAVVIAGEDNVGVFAATLVNNDLTETATLETLDPTDQVVPDDSEPIEIPAGGRTSLFNEDAIPVTGQFKAGDFVEVTLRFDSGQVTTVNIPVMVPCRQYAPAVIPGLEVPTEDATPTESASPDTGTGTDTGSETPTESAEESTDETGFSDAAENDPYSCEPAQAPDLHGGEGGEGGAGAEGTEGESPEVAE